MRDRDPLRQTDPTTRDPVEAYDDPSMILAHGVDAPDPEDPAEPEGLRDAIRDVLAARFTRRSLLSRGAQGLGAAVLASSLPGVFAGPAAARQLDPDGDVKMLNGAIDEGYLQHVTETVVGFGDTEMGWRTGGSPANLQAVDWIAGEMGRLGLRNVAKLPCRSTAGSSTGRRSRSTAGRRSRRARGEAYRAPRPAAATQR